VLVLTNHEEIQLLHVEMLLQNEVEIV
jgi:hypothetical protein